MAEELMRLVAKSPNATVEALLEGLTARTSITASRASMQRTLSRLGFSRKNSSAHPNATRRESSGA
ncbi:hypothetical protein [Myxococcus sp. Y35]|uniref:hypothetical protein n=1 Tax=Pseudomyxococcus flavus TaxID=3115648 RepID=UPI003CED503E